MNEKARRTRPREHALRGSVGPAVRQRVVGVRHGAPHHARVAGRAHLVDHAHARVHRLHGQPPRRSRSTARTTCSAATTSTCGRARPASSRRRATASRRCCGCRRARTGRGRRASARARTPAASWNRATCSTGSSSKASTLFAAKPPRTAATRRANGRSSSRLSSLTRRIPAASLPRRAAASQSYPPPPSPDACAWRASYAFRYRRQTSHAYTR